LLTYEKLSIKTYNRCLQQTNHQSIDKVYR